MNASRRSLALCGAAVFAMAAAPALNRAPDAMPLATAPGIAQDEFPQGCVSCHIVLPDGRDVRLSNLMTQWATEVPALLLERARASAPAGLTINGRHPPVPVQDVPGGCLACHAKESTMAPPFAKLLHLVHLTGGEQNIFVTTFEGRCTHCHKLDEASGAWSIPSGPEG